MSNNAPSDDLAAAKHAARLRAREGRACLDKDACRNDAVGVARNLLDLPELASASVVLAYAALPAELDPMPGVSALRKRGATIAYPRIESPGVLGIHEIEHESALVEGPFGLSEPRAGEPRVEAELVDAVIVPAVAFDLQGLRLGYGGGYYDRLLPALRPDCVRIGVAFDEQVLAQLPAEEHDESVDIVVTPTRVIRPNARRNG
jgi:5-formyltetrahydrofolate cyclo-ligase